MPPWEKKFWQAGEQAGQCITCLLAPVAPLALLSAGHQEIIDLLGVSTATVLARDVPLPLVVQELTPGTQVGQHLFQLLGVPGLGPVGFHVGAAA